MDWIKSIFVIAMRLICRLFKDGLPMLARNLLDGMRATPCIQHTVEFVMKLEDAVCSYIAVGLCVLVIVTFVAAMRFICKTTTTDVSGYRVGNQLLLVWAGILMGSFGFLTVVFLAAAYV